MAGAINANTDIAQRLNDTSVDSFRAGTTIPFATSRTKTIPRQRLGAVTASETKQASHLAAKGQNSVLQFLLRAKHGRYSDYLEELGLLDPSIESNQRRL